MQSFTRKKCFVPIITGFSAFAPAHPPRSFVAAVDYRAPNPAPVPPVPCLMCSEMPSLFIYESQNDTLCCVRMYFWLVVHNNTRQNCLGFILKNKNNLLNSQFFNFSRLFSVKKLISPAPSKEFYPLNQRFRMLSRYFFPKNRIIPAKPSRTSPTKPHFLNVEWEKFTEYASKTSSEHKKTPT